MILYYVRQRGKIMLESITKAEVEKAQKLWGEGIVRIGKAFTEKQDYAATAQNHIDELYDYAEGAVLFKPTKAAEEPFRANPETALSYFVASNGVCNEDKGFAIQPWTSVRFENHEILLLGGSALAMGQYYFTDLEGGEVKVEYSFGYRKDDSGKLRICLHHSSVPYQA